MSEKEKKIFVVDSQRLNTISCMRKYKYTYGEGFEPRQIPIQFERGDLVHTFLEYYYKAKQVKYQWQAANLTHADVVQQAISYMRTRALELNIETEEIEECVRTVTEYATHYSGDGWNEVISVEQPGTKILYEDENYIFVYEVKIDLNIGLNVGGENLIVPVDHKTESRRNPVHGLNNQFMGYAWATGSELLFVNKIGFQKSLKAEEKFRRELIRYSASQIEEWKQNAIYWIKYAIAMITTKNYPMDLTSCDKFSGCTYRAVCNTRPEDRQDKLVEIMKLREKDWDPGRKLED